MSPATKVSESNSAAPLNPRVLSFIRWTGLALLIAILISLAAPSAASASPAAAPQAGVSQSQTSAFATGSIYADPSGGTVSNSSSNSSISANGNVNGSCNTTSESSNPLRSIDRWSNGTTSLHVRLKNLFDFSLFNGISINDPVAHITNGMLDGILLNGGNWAWQTAEGVSVQAEQFCLLYRVGASVDHTAATFGKAIFAPSGGGASLAVILIVIGLVIALGKAMKNSESPAKYILKVGFIAGLALVMISGASKTTTNSATSSDGTTNSSSTSFGFASPGWFAATTDRTVSILSQIPASALGAVTVESPLSRSTGVNIGGHPGTCATMLSNMHSRYQYEVLHAGASSTAGVLSNMWEGSGLLLWARAQFGSVGGAQYGNKVACLVLDAMSGQPVGAPASSSIGQAPQGFPANATTLSLSELGQGRYGVNPAVLAIAEGKVNGDFLNDIFKSDNLGDILSALDSIQNGLDIAGIAYAGCEWNGSSWQPEKDWTTKFDGGGNGISANDCKTFWSKPGYGSGKSLDVSDSNSTTEGNSVESDFLGSWHGKTNNGSTLMGCIGFLISSLLILLVFGGMALGVIIAKTVACVAVIFVFFVLMMELVPSKSDSSRLVKFFKFFASMSLVSYSLGLMLSVITVIVGFLVSASSTISDPGSVAAMLWIGFSPIAAVILIHLIFKHALNMPSPLKPSSALAYAAQASGVGQGAAGGLDQMFGRGARNKLSRYGRRYGGFGRGGGGRGLGKIFGGAAAGVAASEIAHHHGSGAKGATAEEAALRKKGTDEQNTELDKKRAEYTSSAEGRKEMKTTRRAESRERMKNSIESFVKNPVRGTLRGAKKAVKTGAKVGGAVALIGATGGIAGGALAVGLVGRRVLLNTRKEGKSRSERESRSFLDHASTKDLVRQHERQREQQRETTGHDRSGGDPQPDDEPQPDRDERY